VKIYLPLRHNSVFEEVIKHFEIVQNIEDSDVVMLWNDVNFLERGIINRARSIGKKTVVMQHGRKGTSKYYSPFNEKIQADTLLVWGDFDRRSLIGAGQDSSRIRVVGTTVLDGLPDKRPHEGVNVVFCPEHWDKEVEENEWTRDILRKFAKENPNVKITTKIIESHDPNRYDNPIQSNRDTASHLAICAEVLSTADVVVGVSESTFELMAQAMDIPVVIMSEWVPKPFGGDERYHTYRRVISPASAKATRENLEEVVRFEIENPDHLQEERKQVVEDEGGPRNTIELIKHELASF
jgi:hypothetical protein